MQKSGLACFGIQPCYLPSKQTSCGYKLMKIKGMNSNGRHLLDSLSLLSQPVSDKYKVVKINCQHIFVKTLEK